MKTMNPVVHFEMPAEDRKRMADFYTNVFGWQTKFFGEDMGNYVTVATSEPDENSRPKMRVQSMAAFTRKRQICPIRCHPLSLPLMKLRNP